MANKKKTFFEDSAILNNVTYRYYFDRLKELSCSMFEWQNLPDTVDERFMEMTLFQNGCAVFFKDEVLDYLCLPVAMNGRWNVYNIPTQRRAYASNGYNKNLDYKDSVIIYNNYIRTNSVSAVKLFARKLYNLDRIIDVNANAQKTPNVIQCDETQRLTLLNLYKEVDGNAPVVFGDKNMDIKALKVLNTEAPYICDKLYQLKTQTWNEALTYLGISNLNIQKKERLVSDEVVRSVGGTIASRYSRLQARREACDDINKMFGLDIWCDYRDDFREADDEVMLEGDTGDDTVATEMVTDFRTR